MKALYTKSRYQFELRNVTLREPAYNEVVVRVEACGLCGTDIRTARDAADFEPFGHEVAGIVEKAGEHVKNVSPGDRVVLESGSYDRFSDLSRNGHCDLDNNGRHFFNMGYEGAGFGFAERLIASDEVCVKYDGLSLAEASLIEPLGVAYDLVKVTDIALGDNVLVSGIGTIGLCALRLAKLRGAKRVVAVNTKGRGARRDAAFAYGADDVLTVGEDDIEKYGCRFDRVMVTSPPQSMPGLLRVMNTGGVMGFIGIETGDAAFATFDINLWHFGKLQIRSSYAAPALFFPACIDLARSGMIDLSILHTHDLALDSFKEGFDAYMADRDNAIKAIMFNK